MMIVIETNSTPRVTSVAERQAEDETDSAFRTRMVAKHVPSNKRHLINPTLPDYPPERWVVNWQTGSITVGPAPAPTVDQVAAERTRRLALGFDYDFGDERGVHHIGTTEADMRGWSEVSTYAGALIDSGDTETTIAIATDTGLTQVTAPEWRAVEIAAAAFRQPLWAASFALMDTSPTPADYTDDSHWT